MRKVCSFCFPEIRAAGLMQPFAIVARAGTRTWPRRLLLREIGSLPMGARSLGARRWRDGGIAPIGIRVESGDADSNAANKSQKKRTW